MSEALQDPAAMFEAVNDKCEEYEQQMIGCTQSIVLARARVRELEREQELNYQTFLKGKVTEAIYEKQDARIGKELAQQREEEKSAKQLFDRLVQEVEVGAELAQSIRALEEWYAHTDRWTDAEKKDAVQRLVSKVTIDRDGGMAVYAVLPRVEYMPNDCESLGWSLAGTAALASRHRDSSHSHGPTQRSWR
ncbi:MAG: hypothetical protein M3Q29_04965 [Chloroflexota bacterium]|nr:hypothetical protein [Chloroflexota bacterium]